VKIAPDILFRSYLPGAYELSIIADGLYRMAGYLKRHKNDIKLIFRKPTELRPAAMIDSSYAPGKYDRKSISGAIFTWVEC